MISLVYVQDGIRILTLAHVFLEHTIHCMMEGPGKRATTIRGLSYPAVYITYGKEKYHCRPMCHSEVLMRRLYI